MLKINVILIFLLSFHIANGTMIKADLDEDKDVIVYNGKLYYPSYIKIKESTSTSKNNEEKEAMKHSEHEEELVEGAQLWFYIFIILCKYLNNHKFFSFNPFRRTYERLNCWISLNR
jgi:hypothetical protein